MGELGSKPKELYAKHKESAEAHERAQRRMDAVNELKDIVKEKNANSIIEEAESAEDRYLGDIARAERHYRENEEEYRQEAQKDMNLAEANKIIAEGTDPAGFFRGDLELYTLTSADGLQLPDSVGGYLGLSSLTSAEGLTLPTSIGGYLWLTSLRSADGLKLPDSIGMDIYLSSLTPAERNQLRAQRPDLADKIQPSD